MYTLLLGGEGQHILFYLPPRHEQRSELRAALLRRFVFAVEEIARAVGRRFIHDHRAPQVARSRASRADDVLGLFVLCLAPESHLGAMHQRRVATSRRVGSLCRAHLDLTVASGNMPEQARVAVAGHFLRPLARFPSVRIEHSLGIALHQFVEHTADLCRRRLHMSHDKRVESRGLDELEPRHIDLRDGGAAPLPCLEHDDADGLSGEAHLLERLHQAPLRSVEHEGHIVAPLLGFDAHMACRPVREIVAAAQSVKHIARIHQRNDAEV